MLLAHKPKEEDIPQWIQTESIPVKKVSIAISFLGIGKAHDENCGCVGSFDRICNNMQMSVENGIETSVFFTILPQNINQIVQVCEKFKETGICSIRF